MERSRTRMLATSMAMAAQTMQCTGTDSTETFGDSSGGAMSMATPRFDSSGSVQAIDNNGAGTFVELGTRGSSRS